MIEAWFNVDIKYLVIVMVEAGLAASNWLGLTPCINFLYSEFLILNCLRFFILSWRYTMWYHYLYISHVHVATLCQEQLYDLLLKVGKTSSCVEGGGFKGICGIQPAKAYI